ncbi:flagellar motor protein MotA [Deferribacterales bacterium]|nr:flagellar motor protein MotA [Deferribacterales bacterium]
MEISTVLGIALGLFTLIGGMILKGASIGALANPAALVIIFVGTTAALLNAFPMKEFVKMGVMFKNLFAGVKVPTKEEIARLFVSYASVVRKDGLLALENVRVEDPFMATGISMVVDGSEPEDVEAVLESQVEALGARHKLGAQLFAQGGMYAPTLGVMGAVIGLVAALSDLSDIEKLGHAISAAFIATLFGIFTGYVMWHPFSNKLKQMNLTEMEIKRMIIEGITCLQAGQPPRVMQLKMLSYIPDKMKAALLAEWEGAK